MNLKDFFKKRVFILLVLFLTALLAPPTAAGASRSGLNIALAALGGRVESRTPQRDDKSFAAANLIDGLRSQTIGGDTNFFDPVGWRAADKQFPQELVFSFYEGREALIDTMIIDTLSIGTLEGGVPKPDRFPAEVEVLLSSSEKPEDFSPVASQVLPPLAGEHVVSFPPAPARYVMLRIHSTQGGEPPQLAEVKILEAAPPSRSILADMPLDIASSALGGAMVWFTSGKFRESAGNLLWDDGHWKSYDNSFPQEFVLAFNGDRPARIEKVVLEAAGDPKSLPGEAVLYISDASQPVGFREAGRVRFSPDEETLEIPVGMAGRFLKLEILDNHGARNTTLGRIRVFEERDGDMLSVLSAHFDEGSLQDGDTVAGAPTEETEPNDTPEQAVKLTPGAVARGTLSPPGDVDFYSFSVEGEEPRLVKADLTGRVFAVLFDDEGRPLEEGGPVRPGADQGRLLDRGEYFLKVFKPPSSVLLMWDASGSMEAMMRKLEAAVTEYFAALPPETSVNMIEFAGKPRVLLPSFSSDGAELTASMEGSFKAGMGSALYDAMAEGLGLLEREGGDRAMVIFSDGGTQGSKTNAWEIWDKIGPLGVRIYTLGFGASLDDWNGEAGTSNERMLKHFALAGGGRYLRVQSEEELSDLYRQIAADLEGDGTYSVAVRISGGSGLLNVAAEAPGIPEIEKKLAPVIELVFDASGSMNRRIGDKNSPRRIDLAKKSLAEVVDSMPGDAIVALRVFGHRIREGRKGDCQDTELLIPFGPLDRAKLKKAVSGIKALGTTPIAYSLKKAGEDLPPGPGERRILLITDGKEECGGDPAGAVEELRRSGINVRVDVVGFDLEDESDREASRKVAEVSGGVFFDTLDGEGLKESILKTMNPVYEVISAGGEVIARGSAGGGPVKVPEGEYRVSLNLADGPHVIGGVKIEYGLTTTISLGTEKGRIIHKIKVK